LPNSFYAFEKTVSAVEILDEFSGFARLSLGRQISIIYAQVEAERLEFFLAKTNR
jgi:hypothetical protein